jgi:hypothetical protein
VFGWVNDAGSRAREVGRGCEAFELSIVEDPFLDSTDNWLGVFGAADDPLAAYPIGGPIRTDDARATLPSARRTGSPLEPVRRTLRLHAPLAAGNYVLRFFCCDGFYTLLGAAAQRAAAFSVTTAAPRACPAPYQPDCYNDADGADYRGARTGTTGTNCLPWSAKALLQFPSSGLSSTHNFCRNPNGACGP